MKITKRCNVFLSEAAVKEMDLGFFGMPIHDEINRYKKKHGALWVGGKLVVENGKLSCRPPSMHQQFPNRKFQYLTDEVTHVQ